MVREAVVKSLYLVPTPITTSAVRAMALAAAVPVLPMAPSATRVVVAQRALPAWVSATGIPVRSASAASAAAASL